LTVFVKGGGRRKHCTKTLWFTLIWLTVPTYHKKTL